MGIDIEQVEAVILSGGRAIRAGGCNKSLLVVGGRRIIDHQLERLRPVFGDRITVVTDRPEDYDGLGLRCVPDAGELRGCAVSSLRGLASALDAARSPWIFAIGCDMPRPEPAVILKMIERIGNDGAGVRCQAVCLETSGGLQPLHALYRATLAEAAARAVLEGERGSSLSLRRWAEHLPGFMRVTDAEAGLDEGVIAECCENFNVPGECC